MFSMSELPKIAVVVSVASFLAVSPSALHAQSECNARQILQPGNCIGGDLDALEIELANKSMIIACKMVCLLFLYHPHSA